MGPIAVSCMAGSSDGTLEQARRTGSLSLDSGAPALGPVRMSHLHRVPASPWICTKMELVSEQMIIALVLVVVISELCGELGPGGTLNTSVFSFVLLAVPGKDRHNRCQIGPFARDFKLCPLPGLRCHSRTVEMDRSFKIFWFKDPNSPSKTGL
jgi:hypothetical protein